MSFVTPLHLKKQITEPTIIKKTQSHKITNENWIEGKRMDQKIDDLFNKIKRVTSDWNAYVVNSPLAPVQQNTERISRIIPFRNETRYNPQLSKPKSVSKSPNISKTQPKRLNRQISQGPLISSKRQIPSPFSLNVQPTFILPKNKQIQINDFKLGRSLGSGKFGEVYVCQHKSTKAVYALKKMMKGTLKQYDMVNQFKQELKIHSKMNHTNITKMYGFFDDEYHVFMLMQYVQGKQLMQYRKKGQAFTSKVIYQVLRAVQYMQRLQVAHRDIKPQNILLANGVVKLCDFGWAADCSNGMRKTFCGTMDYVSPQVLDQKDYSIQVDIWSVGILTFELISGFAPFPKQTPRFKQDRFTMIEKLNLLFPPQFSDIAKDFIIRILKKNPYQRMSIYECLNHQFIRKYLQDKSPHFSDFNYI